MEGEVSSGSTPGPSGGIYLIQRDGQLVKMIEQAYDSEQLLQDLLAKHPSLLAGEQMSTVSPRQWLLIAREAPLSSEEGGGWRWSIDHLFLDQDGIPTLVEVKRSTDTRVRREVVGQMLDYAANAVVYLPVEEIRARFGATCAMQDPSIDPSDAVVKFLGDRSDEEQFWEDVKTNLKAGKIRLVFVADEIPTELRRIVDFVNSQIDPAEMVAVEVKQYVDAEGGLRCLVPRVVGKKMPPPASAEPWTESSFFRTLQEGRSASEVAIARRLLEWARARTPNIVWGKGLQLGSFTPQFAHAGHDYRPISVWTNGIVQIQFGQIRMRPPFDNEAERLEFLNRLNAVPGVHVPNDAITKYPSLPLTAFQHAGALEKFLEALDWFAQEIRSLGGTNLTHPG